MFQFQTGAIKSGDVDAIVDETRHSFNSKLVRLKEEMNEVFRAQGYTVSIPNWCD